MEKKLKPVNCGCGGEAKVDWTVINDAYMAGVVCQKCGIKTAPVWRRYDLEGAKEEAVTAWNTAMGAGKDKVAITKGYWMVTYDGLHCSVCNYKCETTATPKVCPCCGARLEWK